MKRIVWTLVMITVMEMLHGPAAHAASVMADESAYALASSNLCVQEFSAAERQYGIPKHLLMAIANTESGRFNPQVGKVVPWPWTLNVEGQGAYFENMHDAMTAVKRARQSGKDSIDVGCMQISLKHHPDAFATLLDALNPAENVTYAAKFLRQNYDDLKSWPEAIAAYHSRTPSRGNPYYAMVRQRWQDIRSNAGGTMLENSEYMVAGVKVTRLPVSIATADAVAGSPVADSPVAGIPVAGNPLAHTPDSEFNLAMRDGDTDAAPAYARVVTHGGAKPMVRKTSAQRFGTMKVITVAAEDANSRDAAIVTITPTSQRIVDTEPEDTRGADVSPPSQSSGPNWIFGHE